MTTLEIVAVAAFLLGVNIRPLSIWTIRAVKQLPGAYKDDFVSFKGHLQATKNAPVIAR